MKSKRKITQYKIKEFEFDKTKDEIMKILSMNDFQYKNTLYEIGLKWLQINCIPEMIAIYEKSSIFWKWYINQYSIIDTKFINVVNSKSLYQYNTKQLLNVYENIQKEMPYFPNRVAQKMIFNDVDEFKTIHTI